MPPDPDPRTLPAGRQLDAVMAAELAAFGHPGAHRSRWSSDARAVESLLDDLTSVLMQTPWDITIFCASAPVSDKWTCILSADDWEARGYGPTMALAFCRAFLDKQPEKGTL